MKAPITWLNEYVDINADIKTFASDLTMTGSKVEGFEEPYKDITKVVTGKIIEMEKHPDADKLKVTKVDVGTEVLQIVTGAPNVNEGDIIPIALVGSTLPGGTKISKGKLRGIESYGMMCSIQELNLSKDVFTDAPEDGVYILPNDTELGRDIKEVLKLDEKIVEFEITPNRPDCLSILGLAREVSATYKSHFKKPFVKRTGIGPHASEFVDIKNMESDLCKRYAGRIVENVNIGPSPRWMKDRLISCGVRPINNIVDITNYVMLEYGQPMHAFDLDKLTGNKIIVRKAKQGEKIITLDEEECSLDDDILVIADAQRPVAIAGVMGGLETGVTDETKTILFECANFDGTTVRTASKKVGIRTESSSRFEKGLDPENVLSAIDRACELVETINAGEVRTGVVDIGYKPEGATLISFRPEKINKFLGTNISQEEMVETFKWVGFEMDWDEKCVKVPSFRRDVKIESDLTEEIARFYGYNNIEATLLSGKTSTQGMKTYKQKMEDKIKTVLLSQGISEAYTYSFESPKVFNHLLIPEESKLRNAVVISNPLGEDFSIMRTTTLPSMLKVLSINYHRRVEVARLFEISKIYQPEEKSEEGLPDEREIVTIGMYGNTDFYELKGMVELLMEQLGIEGYQIIPESENPSYHPGRTGKILLGERVIGVLGQIHPEVAENFECHSESYLCELELGVLVQNSKTIKKIEHLPKYPSVQRDIAVIVKEEIMVKQIEDVIRQRAGKILEKLTLFDIYRGKQLEEGRKSIAYSIKFRHLERTLTDEEVNKVMEKIIHGLTENLGAQLR